MSKCPNPACDYTPEPTDWCCEVCGTRLHPEGDAKPGSAAAPEVAAVAAAAAPCACTHFDTEGYCEACGKKREIRPEPLLIEVSSRLASVSDIGMKHHVNQDAALVSLLPSGDYLLTIADGVSTAENSEVASATAARVVLEYMSKTALDNPGPALTAAVQAADNAVRAMPYEAMSSLAEPQATIVTALVRGQQVWISWVGDSRAYELGTQNRALTVDDSWYEMAVAQGMSKEEAQADRRAHAITQCLGMRDSEPEIHLTQTTLDAKSSLVLCTDGLWNYFEEPSALAGIISYGDKADSAMTVARRFVDSANRAGGRDNISVGILQLAA